MVFQYILTRPYECTEICSPNGVIPWNYYRNEMEFSRKRHSCTTQARNYNINMCLRITYITQRPTMIVFEMKAA